MLQVYSKHTRVVLIEEKKKSVTVNVGMPYSFFENQFKNN